MRATPGNEKVKGVGSIICITRVGKSFSRAESCPGDNSIEDQEMHLR